MRVVESRREVAEWVAERRAAGDRVAFVPTMGSLHEGHASLFEVARRNADWVVGSIFVNPLQFGPTEDFERYPRDLEGDGKIAREAGVELVFAPSVDEMYPAGEQWIYVVPESGVDALCGRSRPGHFRGVLTVVAKLFGIVRPDVAVFGRKDYQQLVLIRRMVDDLELGIEIVGAPTIRDRDGLAVSSRNAYLSAEERRRALGISAVLRACQELYASGERDGLRLRDRMLEVRAAGVEVEYAEVVDPSTLASLSTVTDGAVCAIAAQVGRTRLIDNLVLGG